VEKFGQIEHVEVEFGDLTVLVGPQAAGKSLILQTWKLALDSGEIVGALRGAGLLLENESELIDASFGEGMHWAWTDRTRSVANGKELSLRKLLRPSGQKVGQVFFIPAHRALLVSEG